MSNDRPNILRGVLILTLVIFLSGVLVSRLTITDTLFGLGYYGFDKLGYWGGGPYWVQENRLISIVCFFVCPILVSALIAAFMSKIADVLRKRSVYAFVGFLLTCIFLVYGLQSGPEGRLSYFTYWSSNY